MSKFTSGLLVEEIIDDVIDVYSLASSHRVSGITRHQIREILSDVGDGLTSAEEAVDLISRELVDPFGSVVAAQEAATALLASFGIEFSEQTT